MRRTWILAATAIAAATTLAAAVGSAPAAKAKTVTCSLNITVQPPPTPPTGTHFGLIRCGRPLGSGVHHNTFRLTPTSPTTGTFAVKVRNYFDTGTTKSTVQGTYTASSANDITFTGRTKVVGGTGAYRDAGGSGTVNCTSSDAGVHKACTIKLTLRGRDDD